MLKLDLHLHSQYSEDATGSPQELIKILKKKGLQGMAITDHNSIEGGLKAVSIAPKDFIVISGLEVSTKDGHILALNIRENIKKQMPVEQTIEEIIDKGGIPVVPHLFRKMSGIKKEKLSIIRNNINAIEVFNSCSMPKTNLLTSQIAKQFSLGGTGGSDAHDPSYAGYAYTTVDTTDFSVDSILDQIKKRKTWGEGQTMPLSYRQNRMIKSINQFFHRGFKRI
ncbi:MAG: CehA/McbA family metallohydrolase [Thermoplasmatota archaeon]